MSSTETEKKALATRNLSNFNSTRTQDQFVICFAIFCSALTAQATPAGQSASNPDVVTTPFERVLIIGDSHVMGHFGKSLVSQLAAVLPDALIRLVGVCGGSERGLLTGFRTKCGLLKRNEKGRVHIPKECRRNRCDGLSDTQCKEVVCRPKKLRTYIARFRPDLIVFQLGSNSIWMGKPKTNWKRNRRVLKRYVRLLKRSPRACVWITPPDSMKNSSSDQDAFAVIFEEELREVCRVFNSRPHHRPYLNYRQLAREGKKKRIKHDRLHYGWFGLKGRRVQEMWARDVVNFIISMSSDSIDRSSQAGNSRPVLDEAVKPLNTLLDVTMSWITQLNRAMVEMRSSERLRERNQKAKPVGPATPR